jgi:DNA helicase-2/ATP-dependent DNA helicase PcrA
VEKAHLNPEQRAAVEHGDGPLMVLAGAGTGKTRVLVHRIAHLVETSADPRDILAVTFTNKAAGEMRARLRSLLGSRADAMWIGTFHATCARLLRKHGEAVGLTRSFTIFDDDDQMKLVEKLLKETGLDEQVSARTILSRFDRAKNRGLDPVAVKAGSFDDVVERVYPLYQQQLAKENAVDFNDLLLKTLELWKHEATRRILEVRFRHVLVDEFQDTNRVQYELVARFAGATRNLTVVGDDDQSIYAWRGAEPRNLLDFDRDFADAKVIKLEHNYRSTQVILDAANAIIEHNRDRHPKALWTDETGGDLIEVYQAGDERGEAYYVAQSIKRLLDEGPASPSEIAILYRTNAQSRVLEEHLRAARVPAKVVGAVSFFERREVKDVIAYLRLLVNPAMDSACERVVNVPARGLGETTVDRLRAAARASSVGTFEAARLAAHGDVAGIGAAARKKLQGFVELLDGLRDVIAQGASVAETIIQVVDRSGLRAKLEADDSGESRDRLDNLAELVTIASDFDDESAEAQSVDAFLERISLSAPADNATQGETVTLMTIHIAKGLEWPAVFITGMEDGLFPSLREREGVSEDAQLEEERRLAYVAITRARRQLVLTHARTRRVWGEVRLQGPSRFLEDLPPAALAQPANRGSLTPKAPAIVDGSWAAARRSGRSRFGRGSLGGVGSDEFDQRTPDDDPVYQVDADVPENTPFRSGDTVAHAVLGIGRVVAVSGSGKDVRVIVDFPDAGRKTVLPRFLRAADDRLN